VISIFRQHSWAALVAAGIVTAALAQGLFNPTGYAATSIIIWAAVIAGLVSRALPTGRVSRLTAAAGICLAASTVLAAISIGWASDQGRAFDEAVRASFYAGLFVLTVCTGTRRDRSEWLSGLTIGLGLVAIIALFSYLQPGVLDSGLSDVPNAVGRLSYPVGYWNGAGALLAVTAVLLSYAGIRGPTRRLRSAAIAVFPLAVLGLWLTSSRGAGIALAIGLCILIAASPDRSRQLVAVIVGAVGAVALIVVAGQLGDLTSGAEHSAMRADGDLMSAVAVPVAAATGALAWWSDGRRPRLHVSRRLAVILGSVVLAALVAGVVAADPGKRLNEFEKPPSARAGVAFNAADLSSNGRWQFWGEAIDAFESNPFGGVGAGGFEDWWARHAPVAIFVRNPHSLPLQQASELGVPGLLLFCGFLAALGIAAVRRLRAGLTGDVGVLLAVVAAGAIGAAVDWTWEIPAVFGPVVVCAALLLASARSRPLARDGYLLGVGTVAAAWVAMVAGGLVVLTQIELDRSRSAAADGRIAEAIHRAEQAHTVTPWSAEPFIQLALLEQDSGNPDQGLRQLKEAESRDSKDWRLPLIEASLQSQRGDTQATRAALQRTAALSPKLAGALRSGQG
jgi:O-antigen ligase/polysaccharide polymerase Wzy-like membrane protein